MKYFELFNGRPPFGVFPCSFDYLAKEKYMSNIRPMENIENAPGTARDVMEDHIGFGGSDFMDTFQIKILTFGGI